MSSIKHKLEEIAYYSYLVNPLIPKKYRICRSFAREAHRYYDFLEESQWWPEEKLKEYQDGKLRNLINHAYKNVPYYREVFDRHGIGPQDIRSSDDLVKVPILTKDIIRKNFPDRITAALNGNGKDGIWTTGGSTGEPLKFYADIKSSSIAWAAFFRFCRWTGYNWGDSIAVFWRAPAKGNNTSHWHHSLLDWLQKTKVPNLSCFDASRMGEEQLAEYVLTLSTLKPVILRGYVSALTHLAEYYSRVGVECIRPEAIITTAEMLNPNDRRLLRRQFGADVFDQYGSAECMGVGFECREHKGLHLTTEHCVVEFIDEKGGRVETDEKGKMLVTDLDNYDMPFIRYMNGDEGSYRSEECACGRSLPLLNFIDGRSMDMIIGINGNSAHGLFFVTLLQELGWFEKYGIQDFEIVQKKSGQIECNFVCRGRPDTLAAADFIKLCRNHLGEMHIGVNFVDQILPCPSGKRRYTRSEIIR